MKSEKLLILASQTFIALSALSIAYVSVMAIADPQKVMSLVNVELNNTDAYSSIRGVYGGVGLTLTVSLIYLCLRNVRMGLGFLSILWGCYALSRLTTMMIEGPLGEFGRQWLTIESLFTLIAVTLLAALNRKRSLATA